jgi:hypothetical protein
LGRREAGDEVFVVGLQKAAYEKPSTPGDWEDSIPPLENATTFEQSFYRLISVAALTVRFTLRACEQSSLS